MTLIAENLSIIRGQRRVVDGVSTALEPGTITAIVGPNGAGKTSLLMGLAGLLPAYEGRVMLAGRRLGDISVRDRAMRIGYLPQNAEIAWDVAVENLVALGRLPHRDRLREPIEDALDAMDLAKLRHRPASRLSGGERARALLARVLAGTPDWILADEPLAALDLGHQHRLITHLKDCAAGGAGVVIVLHDLGLASNHADRVMVLSANGEGGKLVADDIPERALSTQVITDVWGIEAQWLGEPGRRALIARAVDRQV